jgi:hypothetical protein
MADQLPRGEADRGRITSGLARNVFVERTLEFVRDELPKWRDDPARPSEESEERLNAQLCKYLNVVSRQKFPMVYFHHEEKQMGTRRVDFSALLSENQFVGATFHSIYDPFIVFEGKRLPSPTRDREREYVTGGESKSGGIQRFKLGLHGAKHELAALIGYIQEGELREWFAQINNWIRDLETTLSSGDEKWSANEQLANFVEEAAEHIADVTSLHPRVGEVVSPNIRIRHLWVRMGVA